MRTSILYLALVICFSSCQLANVYEGIATVGDASRAELLINKTVSAYGGQDNWERIKTASARVEDYWPTYHWRLIASPWKNKRTTFKMDWQTNSNNSRVEVLSGKWECNIAGIQQWSTYLNTGSSLRFKDDKAVKFHLPTMEYFFEFPFRIREADVLAYGGKKTVNTINYDIVKMSWSTLEPQTDVDQYLIYINPHTHLIDFIEFTVRDHGNFPFATVHFENFRQVDEFVMPHQITAYFQNHVPGKTIGHQMTVESYTLGQEFPADYFVPEPGIRSTK